MPPEAVASGAETRNLGFGTLHVPSDPVEVDRCRFLAALRQAPSMGQKLRSPDSNRRLPRCELYERRMASQAPGDVPRAWGVGALPLGGLAILEACCFVGAAGGVAGAVRVSAGARQHSAIDDQVLLTYRTAIEPALQDLTCSGRIARLRRE
jgi:hypothetical protein